MSDLIRRDDAIRELSGVCSTWEDDAKVQEIVMAIPSAEASQNLAKPNKALKGSDLISRQDAIEAVTDIQDGSGQRYYLAVSLVDKIRSLPSADAVSREEYEETDGVITIEKQSAKDVGEIKHIIIRSPNYTRYFYNESMPISAEAETVDCTDFIRWLTETVMDDGMWELIAVAYGEVIARKLTKLGVLEVKDGYYIRHINNNTKESDLVYRPSAEAVQGEWGHIIADGSDGSHWYEYECSHCGEVVLRPYNFCPNCGTMMYKDGDDTTGESL